MKIFYTYVLKSLKDSNLYIGWTDNLKQKLDKNNKGLVVSTKNRKPLKIVSFEGCLSKSKAIEREKSLKTGFGRKYLKSRIL